MKWIDYRKKLRLGFEDSEKLSRVKAQAYNFLYGSSIPFVRKDEVAFCNEIGAMAHEVKNPLDVTWLSNDPTGLQVAWTYMKEERSLTSFISKYVALINSYAGNKSDKKKLEGKLLEILTDCQIPYDIIKDADGIFVFPKGAKELDDELISGSFEWLKDYPETRKAWIAALKDYSDATELTASETADNFRKALERFFQEFFGSKKSLENLKSEYGTYMTSKGVLAELKNNFEKLLESYTNYINNYAKHHDKTSQNVLEYIMYQTANLMRLVITLNRD